MFGALVKRLSVGILTACFVSFLGTGILAGGSSNKLTFDTWNVPYAEILEMKELDINDEIDFEFQSREIPKYDFMLVVYDGPENVRKFP